MKKTMRLFSGFLFATALCFWPFQMGVSAAASDKSAPAFGKMTDRYMRKVINDYKVAGVAVAVVKEGRVFFQKGYGFADIDRKIPVDPDKTMFQIASVSKLFTATAAMQLVEQGKLSLDEDINHYLTDFKIRSRFSKPVTLRNLLTHTAGFDERTTVYYKSTGNRYFDSLEPLGKYLKDNMPPIIREPGTFCQYSVYGMALAGYLVEKQSQTPIAKYIKDNIFNPLDMRNSSYGLYKNIFNSMAKPYVYSKGKYFEGAYTLCGDHPSGSICASVSNMAKFMIMQLNYGEYRGTRLLKETTCKAMQRQQYPDDPRLTGFGFGFYETVRNGRLTIEHGGYLPSFASKLTLLPEEHIGLFVAINTDSLNSSKVCNELTDKFYGFFTEKVKNNNSESGFKTHPLIDLDYQKINGIYSFDPYGRTDLTKLKSILLTGRVQCDPSGDLLVETGYFKCNYQYIGKGLFYSQSANDYCKISFRNNQAVLSVLGGDYEKTAPFDIYLFYGFLAGIPFLIISIMIIPITMLRRKRSADIEVSLLKGSLLITSVLVVGYLVLNALMGIKSMASDTDMVVRVIIPMIHGVCYLTLLFTAVSLVLTTKAWVKNKASLGVKMIFSVLTVLTVADLIFMAAMNGFILN